jgi:anti-sigma-K factor RskA
MIDERTEEQAATYALGALSAEEAKVFEAQLQRDPELRKLVSELRDVSAAVAGQMPGLSPSAAVKARVLREMEPGREPPVRARRSPPWMPWGLAAAFALAAVLFGWQGSSLRQEIVAQSTRIRDLNLAAEMLRTEDADLRRAVLQLQASNRLANMRIAVLNSLLASAPKAIAVSVWDNDRQNGVFVVRGLKPAPPGKDYQLWVIDPKYPTPVDAGVFQVDAQGRVRVEFKAKMPIQAANQFAVTQEVKGGSPVPTISAMVLAGS